MSRLRGFGVLLVSSLLVAGLQPVASAVESPHSQVVATIPTSGTPNVNNGTVFAIAQVGNTMVIGGSFTTASPWNAAGTVYNLPYVLSFNATTGAINTGFLPAVNGTVQTLLPGPTANTVYIGGSFTTVGGQAVKSLTLVNLSNGSRVAGFAAPGMNGLVNAVERVGNRLFVGGTFTIVGGQQRGGIMTLNATTGALDSFMTSKVTVNHNWTPENGGAKAAIGVKAMDITADGTKLVAVGNFKLADGLPRDQVAMWDLTGATAVVRADYRIRGYEAACYSFAFDSYVRDVKFSPDGTYLVIGATGGGTDGNCDTASRWETGASSQDVPRTWASYSGGDSILSVAITGPVVYAGGHQRWMNNPYASDFAGPGAVPRPGLAALDADTGIPVAWNPGRNPRGSGAWALFATPDGLWMGSDTTLIGPVVQGGVKYTRKRIAFFPLAGGAPLASDAISSLPGGVYLGGSASSSTSAVLQRVNFGGGTLASTDGGPDWQGDGGEYANTGNTAGWSPVANVDATVPSSTPRALFDSERWDGGDSPEMQLTLPVPAGKNITVRLYFANRYEGTGSPGARVFDVSVNGTLQLNDYDIVADVGDQTGTMKTVAIPAAQNTGQVTVDFGHVVENPLINGIEIIDDDFAATEVLQRVNLGGGLVGSTDGGPNWVADNGQFSNTGNLAGWSPVPNVDATVPSSTPRAIFDSERWDGGENPEMQLTLPVPAGKNITVRLYFANRCGCTASPGARVFDVSVNGTQLLNDYDIVADVGDQTGTMKTVAIPAAQNTGLVTINFGHVAENPLINGVEIIDDDFVPPPPPPPGALIERNYDGTTVGAEIAVSSPLDFNTVRGATLIGGRLFYGKADSNFYSRTFDGSTFGAETLVDPYNDPIWSDTDSGSGGTFRGQKPSFYGEIPNLTSMFYDGAGKLYYTLLGDGRLFWRAFSPDSGILHPDRIASGSTLPAVNGAFLDAGSLYYVTASDGKLNKIGFAGGQTVGAPVVADASVDWRAKALFLGPGQINDVPVASFTTTCEEFTCTFDGSDSDDPDGTIESYTWDFGDSGSDSGAVVEHTYSLAGDYTVELTVEDNQGATGSTSSEITVPAEEFAVITYRSSAAAVSNSAQISVTVPANVQAGDALVLVVSSATAGVPNVPAGWTLVDNTTNNVLRTTVYQRMAVGGTAGSVVTVQVGSAGKNSAVLGAYTGVDPTAPVAQAVALSDTNQTAHVTPVVTVTAGQGVLSYWVDRSSAASGWTVGAGAIERIEAVGNGAGRHTAALADAGAPVAAGTAGGVTATSVAVSPRATAWTVVLNPATL